MTEYRKDSQKIIEANLKDIASDILKFCNSTESDSKKRSQLEKIATNLDNISESGLTTELRLYYFMLASFIQLRLENATKALELTTKGLQCTGLENNPFLLYNTALAYLINGNKTGLQATLDQLKETNLLEVADSIESYMLIRDKDEWES